jgi:hypothetical protein
MLGLGVLSGLGLGDGFGLAEGLLELWLGLGLVPPDSPDEPEEPPPQVFLPAQLPSVT